MDGWMDVLNVYYRRSRSKLSMLLLSDASLVSPMLCSAPKTCNLPASAKVASPSPLSEPVMTSLRNVGWWGSRAAAYTIGAWPADAGRC